MKSKHLAASLIKLCQKYSPDDAERKFFYFIKKNNLLYFMPQIIFYLGIESQKKKDGDSIKIISSCQLSQETKNKIKEITEAPKQAPEMIKIDKNIIGGFIAKYNNITYDASLSSQLKKMRAFLNGADNFVN